MKMKTSVEPWSKENPIIVFFLNNTEGRESISTRDGCSDLPSWKEGNLVRLTNRAVVTQ